MSGQGKNSPTIGENGFLTQPGEVSAMLSSINEISKLPKVETDEELIERVDWYFQFCASNDIRPGVEGLALACGVDRRTLWDWQVGNSRSGTMRGEIIKEAKQRLAMFHEALMLYGRINPVTGIFLAKNNYGYTDRTELEVTTGNNLLGPQLTPEEIAKRIPKDIPIDTVYEETSTFTVDEIAKKISRDLPAEIDFNELE